MLYNSTITDFDKSLLDIIVTILGIIGGLFGGIPAIITWMRRPRLCIKRFDIGVLGGPDVISFTVANEGILSKNATELEIKCLLQNEEAENRMESGLLSDDGRIPIPEASKSKILIDGLPNGASTNIILFTTTRSLPYNFKFWVFLKYKEGKTILKREISNKK